MQPDRPRCSFDARISAPVERGAPLIGAHAVDSAIDGLELVLKGGQMGGEGFFETVRLGG